MLFIKHNICISQCMIAGLAVFAFNAAHAEIYKQVDAQGRVTYSNVPMKGATKLNLEPLNTVPATRSKASTPSPSGFPKVDGDTQKKRDDTRRKILEDELAAEEKLLMEASAQKDATAISLHEKNVAALKKELANIK
ncbi:hypothetical protein SKTS_03880 [Sulfurimicrobium lacus]|uniref:DUF4124 domain-containing protein n=1 Tax=Sulfurimicrobium lacus TaxID=2715678 RepID=A0A6F8V953_9PROT|nr:DUF4124 domain-containing protein [Sulfurimicrobium lacus]BCB25502.1 hypothetical protein SKTS_03880 [Sulfurimicrobium lacus]